VSKHFVFLQPCVEIKDPVYVVGMLWSSEAGQYDVTSQCVGRLGAVLKCDPSVECRFGSDRDLMTDASLHMYSFVRYLQPFAS
jgi:nitroimidazol reductase NimA-like FMN-containing flavoprotein (pyridoxamine 5'-phosphate oxidase superfamily)